MLFRKGDLSGQKLTTCTKTLLFNIKQKGMIPCSFKQNFTMDLNIGLIYISSIHYL